MVVVAAAVCTRSGKVLMGRAYVEVARARLEGLLAAFPKLLPADSQHTFVETDAVRYVYQPLEQLFVLMVTTKSSNILEDLETLHLLAKLVPEYCKSAKEDDVTRNVFELIFAFDEVLQPLGVREKINVGQVKTFMEMESHEEKIFEMVEKNKQREAKEQAKLRQAQIDRERQEAAKSGRAPGFGGGGRPPASAEPAYVVRPSPPEQRAQPPAAASAHKPGLDLKKGPSKTDAFLKQLGIQDVPAAAAAPVLKGAAAAVPPPVSTAPVHLTLDEKLQLTMSRDGALEQMDLKGDLFVTIASADKGLVQLKLSPVDQRVWKFSTHPKINKQLFASDSVVSLADNTKPFPAGNALGVLKWRIGAKDESFVPVRVSCWVTPSPTSTSVSLEYELLITTMELRNFSVTMLVPGANPPVFEGNNEGASFNAKQRTLTWALPLVDQSNATATLDFTVNGTIEQAAFFPIRVAFASTHTLCPLHVQEVLPVGGGAPQKFSVATSLTVEQYDII